MRTPPLTNWDLCPRMWRCGGANLFLACFKLPHNELFTLGGQILRIWVVHILLFALSLLYTLDVVLKKVLSINLHRWEVGAKTRANQPTTPTTTTSREHPEGIAVKSILSDVKTHTGQIQKKKMLESVTLEDQINFFDYRSLTPFCQNARTVYVAHSKLKVLQ